MYNRKLFVLDIPTYPSNSSADSTISVATFDSESRITAASLGAEKVGRLAEAFRNVQEGTLARGALNNYHLSSPVVAKKQAEITAATHVIQSKYPGYNTSTVTTNSTGNGWFLLNNGSETLSATAPTTWDVTTESIFIVMANVQVKSVRPPKLITGDVDHFGALALGYNNSSSGATTILGQSEVYVNHYNSLKQSSSAPVTTRNLEEEYDVALFAVVKHTEISTAPNYFAVYGATMDNGTTPVSLAYHRGHITVIQLKA